MYADLNVLWPEGARAEADAARLLAFARLLGYDVVAFSVEAATVKAAKQALATRWTAAAQARLQAQHAGVKVLRRVTLVLDEGSAHANVAQLAAAPDAADVIAVAPRTEKQLQTCAASLDIDVICVGTAGRLPFRLRHALVGAAMKRGVHFEVCHALDRPAQLRHVIANAAALLRAARGRGVVVSSGAAQPTGLRAPKDVENMLQLWGFRRGAAHDSVATNPLRAATQGVLRARSVKQAVLEPRAPADPPAKRQRTQ